MLELDDSSSRRFELSMAGVEPNIAASSSANFVLRLSVARPFALTY